MPKHPIALLVACALVAATGDSFGAPDESIGELVSIPDLLDIERPPRSGAATNEDLRAGPHIGATTAELQARTRPSPDRLLPGGLRIITRCDRGCCVDGLMAGDKALLAPGLDRDDRRTCRHGWIDRIVRVAYQDESAISIYVAKSWLDEGAAHANNTLQCRSFDLATGKPLELGDVRPGGAAARALARARRRLRGSLDFTGFSPTAAGIRFRRAKPGGREVQFCAEGWYPSRSDQIVEIDAR